MVREWRNPAHRNGERVARGWVAYFQVGLASGDLPDVP